MYAAACVGAVAVPLNTYTKKRELQSYLSDAKPVVMIIGTKGQHVNYPALMKELISESHLKGNECSWIPSTIFILEDVERLSPPFKAYSELFDLALKKSRKDFFNACNSTSSNDPFILIYTSGTLGVPKGVLRSTASFLVKGSGKDRSEGAPTIMMKIIDKITRKFPIMNLLPLYHLGGFSTIFTSLKTSNIRIIMLSHFNPINALSVISKEKCRFLVGTPFMIQQMLNIPNRNKKDLESLIGLIFTSSAVNNLILKRVTSELKLLFFMVSYGSTEAGSVANGVCFLNRKSNPLVSLLIYFLKHTNLVSGLIDPSDFEETAYSLAGKVDKSVEIRIVDKISGDTLPLNQQGEITIRSHRVMRYAKYTDVAVSFTKDGWYKSADLGFLNEKGQLIITSRLHRLISRGGEKISPVEIENALLKLKSVEEAIVVGIPDELYGEQICACIVAKKGEILTTEKLHEELLPNLSTFKVPKYFVFLDQFPISSTGKISVSEIQMLAIDMIGEREVYA
jgi:fatty-acyl-CoA synthase